METQRALVAAAVVFATCVVGLLRMLHGLSKWARRESFGAEFHRRFQALVSSHDFRADDYTWLTRNSIAMQNELNPLGSMDYKPPGSREWFSNYQLLPNTLAQIRSKTADPVAVAGVDDALLRYGGEIQNGRKRHAAEFRNPLLWFRSGVQAVLTIPLHLLNYVGVMSDGRRVSIERGPLFRLVAGALSLFGLLGTIVGVVTGWSEFVATVGVWPW